MGSKLIPGAYDCYAAALPDEPMFVLLARDPSAPVMLRAWADARRKRVLAEGGSDEDLRKCTEADGCADDMTIWRRANEGRWREGTELRDRVGPATDEQLAEVAAAIERAVTSAMQLPADVRSNALTIEAHSARPWRSPLFAGRTHRLLLGTVNDFAGVPRRLDLRAIVLQHAIVADFEAEVFNASTMSVHLMLVIE